MANGERFDIYENWQAGPRKAFIHKVHVDTATTVEASPEDTERRGTAHGLFLIGE